MYEYRACQKKTGGFIMFGKRRLTDDKILQSIPRGAFIGSTDVFDFFCHEN